VPVHPARRIPHGAVGRYDLDAKEWRYVATKTDVDHIVPLADQVVQYLGYIHSLTGNDEYVFGVRGGIRHLSDCAINTTLKTLNYASDVIQPTVSCIPA